MWSDVNCFIFFCFFFFRPSLIFFFVLITDFAVITVRPSGSFFSHRLEIYIEEKEEVNSTGIAMTLGVAFMFILFFVRLTSSQLKLDSYDFFFAFLCLFFFMRILVSGANSRRELCFSYLNIDGLASYQHLCAKRRNYNKPIVLPIDRKQAREKINRCRSNCANRFLSHYNDWFRSNRGLNSLIFLPFFVVYSTRCLLSYPSVYANSCGCWSFSSFFQIFLNSNTMLSIPFVRGPKIPFTTKSGGNNFRFFMFEGVKLRPSNNKNASNCHSWVISFGLGICK